MKNFLPFTTIKRKSSVKGFVLPFTMLITVLILFIMAGAMTLLSKQMYFSKLYRQSQAAYYAADDAISCAIDIDDTFIGSDGYGIFPYNGALDEVASMVAIADVVAYVDTQRSAAGLPTINDPKNIKCSQADIFDTDPTKSKFTISAVNYQYNPPAPNPPEFGKTSTYKMKMPLGDGFYRCAKVTINKTATFRQIIAQGYATCDSALGSVERAVVNTTSAQ